MTIHAKQALKAAYPGTEPATAQYDPDCRKISLDGSPTKSGVGASFIRKINSARRNERRAHVSNWRTTAALRNNRGARWQASSSYQNGEKHPLRPSGHRLASQSPSSLALWKRLRRRSRGGQEVRRACLLRLSRSGAPWSTNRLPCWLGQFDQIDNRHW